MKFKIGDRVIGNEKADREYHITKKGYIGKVTDTDKGSRSDIKLNDEHWVSSSCFDLYQPIKEVEDLQFADILTLRNGQKYVKADEYMMGEESGYISDGDTISSYYNDDLTHKCNDERDIIEVKRDGMIIFEREEAREMTVAEISEALGYEVKVVK